MQEHNSCLLSGSKDLVPIKGYQGLVKSRPLGFVFHKRIPTVEELEAHYAKYSRNDYLSPLTVARYNDLLDSFEPHRKTGRILDLGCGVGFFLEVAKKRGWEVYGTEFSDKSIEMCQNKGIEMKQGKTHISMFPAEYFDVVTSFEVIEHINHPLEEMACVVHFMRPGGLFYCTTPNFNAIERYKLKSAYRVICYPEHLSYYTPKTFHYLMKKFALKKVFLQTTGISISTLFGDKIAESAPGRVSSESKDEKLREALDSGGIAKFIKSFLNGILSFLGVGNSLKASYVKPL